ncbi:hypothetical protein [Janthinobacterium sp. 75]|uniref:hypothetical protein n=1 Tax=Janthinobacterium sp. 75 TaxID=2135628 RepID=UPI001062F427|nr:hypothetical protein [Janthinobacterium sp. 75]TDY34436.1 hypothetical protein C8C89_2251 [Janthinobacterium sp. 75]
MDYDEIAAPATAKVQSIRDQLAFTIREKMMGNSTTPQPGNSQGGTPSTAGSKQSTAESAESFVLVDSEQGLDIGDDLFSIGEVRRADRLPHRQSGAAGQNRQSADDAPDTTGSTGV